MERYDVFISFKNSDSNGRITRDAVMAETLYRTLKQKNISTFFSKYSISEAARADYVDAIDNALESALVFVAVGTSKENLTSGWVKHEINQFRAMLNEDQKKKRSIVSYRSVDFSPNDLPSGLRCYQSYDDVKSVARFVEACLQKASGFRNEGDGTELLYESGETGMLHTAVPKIPSQQELKTGSVLDDRYEICNLIGKGGMSCIYLARDKRINKIRAIKELFTGYDRESQKVLENIHLEAQLLQSLDHPAIPKVFDVIDGIGSTLIVMEYVEGNSLAKALTERRTFPEEQVLDFARQLGEILHYLHSCPLPIIYRDMKPANIMLQPDGKLKLIDFGTARKYKENALGDTVCLGTVGFAAPEQFGGMGQSDARTDIYNLGATLYHLVTGQNPAEPPYEILPVRQIDPKLSRKLERIIQKCTQKDPNKRYQSVKELLSAIERDSVWESLFTVFKKKKKQQTPPEPFRIPGDAQTRPQIRAIPPGFAPVSCVPGQRPVAPPIPEKPVPERHKAPAEPLFEKQPVSEEEAVPPKPAKEKETTKKVAVRKKPSGTDPETEQTMAKFAALDPRSRQLVCDLIDQLSQQ